ncbi:hypothetical protein GUITHDRAFT_122922 [Guillardia theta CCMP2712]|uniref:ABC1 atypical kinase-like domain-containing protein n=2 Tax=Guillardia theta TaxID=55529 RepID=L1I3S7_GUITC|nr:hypothetical protein GUITHDRAFT_122922 [Guillardia theta CCMP2712]EKX30871.1 hypothetical protein GUITHDRAFT_122922 [Guillardia theta CCMP2712]|eukprot:XP_005817851.1 hypothetical protein GUITHDRAFT_122922 [Guillardia theta CCMP2712]
MKDTMMRNLIRRDETRIKIDSAARELEEADRIAKQAEQRLASLLADGKSSREAVAAAEKEAQETMQRAADRAENLVKERKLAEMSETTEDMRRAHQRSAERLLSLARANKGAYIKIAQHLSQMDYLLPDEYTTTLRACLDDAPRSSFENVSKTIEEDLGKPVSVLFASFDKEAIASASLAQVHVAHLHPSEGERTGRKVAVKVQHYGLRETAVGDVDAVRAVVQVVSKLFPAMPLWWLADEIAPNLPIELDFQQEAKNAERCRSLFKHDPFVVVPEIFYPLSSSR